MTRNKTETLFAGQKENNLSLAKAYKINQLANSVYYTLVIWILWVVYGVLYMVDARYIYLPQTMCTKHNIKDINRRDTLKWQDRYMTILFLWIFFKFKLMLMSQFSCYVVLFILHALT